LPFVTAVKDALGKARSGAAMAVRAPARGAAWAGKRIRWRTGEAASSVRRAFGSTGQGIGWGLGGVRRGVRSGFGRVGSALEAPRARVTGTVESARQRPRHAVAIAAAILVGVAWIAWAVYVTASNGATAGLGVLLTWPILLGALALIAAPVVLTAMLVQRHRDSTPAMAGAPNVPEPPKQEAEAKAGSDGEDGEAKESEPKNEQTEPAEGR
jgi:hypothetical protein